MSRFVLAALALVTCGPLPPLEQTEPTTTTSDVAGSATAVPEPTSSSPLDCESVCDAPWTHDGDLEITPLTDFTGLRCLRRVTGNLTLRDFSGSLPAELLALRDVDGMFALQHNDVDPFGNIPTMEDYGEAAVSRGGPAQRTSYAGWLGIGGIAPLHETCDYDRQCATHACASNHRQLLVTRALFHYPRLSPSRCVSIWV